MKEHDLVTYTCPDCGKSRQSKWKYGRPYDGERLCNGCGISRRKRSDDWTRTHNLSRTPLYRVWSAMLQRCNNPNNEFYARYGGRGIKVCARWVKFENFQTWALANGYVKGLIIDRSDNDGGYAPSNCVWVSSSVSGANRSNVKLNEQSVREIRSLLASGSRPIDVAGKFGVNPRTISEIKHGRKWAWVQ